MAEAGLPGLVRQALAFTGVGIVAAIVHYGLLIGLVESGAANPVPATLAGYVAGGIASYWLNRRHTYRSDRPHEEATWRFAIVAFVGFLMTWGLMHLMVGRWGFPYLPAQLATTGLVLVWSFLAHKFWTFATAGDAP